MPAITGRAVRQMMESMGEDAAVAALGQSLRDKELRSEDFSIRDLFEHTIDDGPELLRAIDSRRKSGHSPRKLMEAAQAVDTSAFSNITGQIIYNKTLEGYENPELLWPQLFDNLDTNFLQSERIPGIGGTGDVAEVVDEGQPYPIAGLNEEYVDFGPAYKYGFILPITREIIVADRTGLLLKQASDSGYHYLGIRLEKHGLDIALGQVNTYKRNTVSSNTYTTSGGYINAQTGNALTSWRSLENAELLFDAITDPNTGEPMIVAGEMTMIVPTALKMTAYRIIDATSVGVVDNQVAAGTIRQYGPNTLKSGKMVHATSLKVLSSAYVKNRTSSGSKWFYGQPKRAFLKRTVWNVEAAQAASNSEAEFLQDIWQRHKVSTMTMFGTQNPRYMTSNDT